MASFEVEKETPQPIRIKVIGVGGCGCNTVSDMINMNVNNAEFYAVNTDVQSLKACKCPNKIQIGKELTNGLGAGSNPQIGEQAALTSKEVLEEILTGADMVFIAAGMGGGTGTGAAPIVAKLAKEKGALTVAVVTRPFRFEGNHRMQLAEEGIEKLRQICDTVMVISNERLLEVVGNKASIMEAFHVANGVLAQGVQSILELISQPGYINIDFANIRTIMGISGGAVMGIGVAKGENRTVEAVKRACSNQLLDKIVIDGAKGILISISGPRDITLYEVDEAVTMVKEAADKDALIIFGVVPSENLKDEVKATLIATGFKEEPRKTARVKKPGVTNVDTGDSTPSLPTVQIDKNLELPIFDKPLFKDKPAGLNIGTQNELQSNIFIEDDKTLSVTPLNSIPEEPKLPEPEKKVEKAEKRGESEYDIPAIFRRRLIF